MLRAIIVDDEQRGINSIKLLVEKYVSDVKIVASTTDPQEAIGLIEDYKPEIVFLDINMPHLNGFEVLNHLAFRDFHLIFTTAHEEYALQALKKSALDYLLKPIDVDDLLIAVDKAKHRSSQKQKLPDLEKILTDMQTDNTNRISVSTKEGVENLHTDDIIRAEASSNYAYIYTVRGEKLLVAKTLKELETVLTESRNFMRIHQSHIINLKHTQRFIKEGHGIILMSDNFKVPVSKHKKDDFLHWLGIH
jgi:two-component system LytT family response regulator